MTMLPLQDKVVLVTGAGKRVGAAIVRRLHAAGATLALHYHTSEAEAAALGDELNRARAQSVITLRADLLDLAALNAMIETCAARCRRLDALVNNASAFYPTPLGAIGEREWEELVGTNLRAPLFLAQAAAPLLRAARGCIVNITDIHAERPLRRYLVYSVAKAGLVGLTKALARELGPEIRVNAIAPGPIVWPEDGSFDAATQERVIAHTLLKRVGDPEDIARAVQFLIADAPYVTGQVLAVDGGRSVNL